MEICQLVEALSAPSAFPDSSPSIEIRQTHISVVFLGGSTAYKIKKPVNLGFLDFSTLENRQHFCHEEVRLNRRLAPSVYLGVVPVVMAKDGLHFEGKGEIAEWAVKMKRLADDATLLAHLKRDELDAKTLEDLAAKIADFHSRADRSERTASMGRFEVVARNVRENLDESIGLHDVTLSRSVHERLRSLSEQALVKLRPLIEERARRGVPCDTHGDLRLEHVYLLAEQDGLDGIVVIDCVEFNERFRYADPVADMAFIVMDLLFSGRSDLARAFSEAYLRRSGDAEGRLLLPFYIAYRAAVRGKVEGIKFTEPEVPETERVAARERAKRYWLLALGKLEEPNRKPCLVLVGGLPGTGKSTLAEGLSQNAGFEVVRSDLVRKEMAGLSAESRAPARFGEGIYTSDSDSKTYAECLRRTEEHLFQGKRVIVDATFREEEKRRLFLQAAHSWGVSALFLHCQADANIVHRRLESRRNDASDADWAIHQKAAERWEPLSEQTRPFTREMDLNGSANSALAAALDALADAGIYEQAI